MQPLIDELQKRHPEIFQHFGKSYVAEGVRFQGSTPQIQALAINELEIAAFGPAALALAVNNAHLDVRIVADVFQDGVPGYRSVTYVVRADGPIKTVEDLQGQDASPPTRSARSAIRRCASCCTSTASPTATSPRSRRISPTCRRCSTTARSTRSTWCRSIDYMLDAAANTACCSPPPTARAASRRRSGRCAPTSSPRIAPALVDFLEDHVRAVQWLLDPAHHEEAVAIAAEVTKAKPETLDYMYTKDDSYHAPDGRPDVAATQHALDVEVKSGLIQKGLTVAPKYVDLGPVEEAAKRLGGS